MMSIMKTKYAASCVLFVRPRPADLIRLAITAAPGQGTTVSAVALRRTPVAVAAAPIFGDNSVDVTTPKTIDVARSLRGRPPV